MLTFSPSLSGVLFYTTYSLKTFWGKTWEKNKTKHNKPAPVLYRLNNRFSKYSR